MFSKKLKKYTLNPGLAILPFLVFYTTYWITGKADFSLIAGIIFAAVVEPSLKLYNKVSRSGIGFYVVILSFVITLIVWIFSQDHITNSNFYAILPELITVIILMLLRISKSLLNFRFFRKNDGGTRVFLSHFFQMATYLQYFLTIHVFISVIYMNLTEDWIQSPLLDKIIFLALPIAGIISVIIYEQIKISKLAQKLRKEEWLPIVTENGNVIGKIAKSVSLKLKNKHLHPVVRVALVYDGHLYLQKRNITDVLDPQLLDHPFEKYILFQHEITLAAQNSMRNMIGKDLDTHFLLKYTFENEKTKRLVFLFVARLKNEAEFENIKSLKGKFWTSKQIEDDFGDNTTFSECFQLEYEYLKNTVLLPDEIIKRQISSINRSNK